MHLPEEFFVRSKVAVVKNAAVDRRRSVVQAVGQTAVPTDPPQLTAVKATSAVTESL
jgi:hypothetical protein